MPTLSPVVACCVASDDKVGMMLILAFQPFGGENPRYFKIIFPQSITNPSNSSPMRARWAVHFVKFKALIYVLFLWYKLHPVFVWIAIVFRIDSDGKQCSLWPSFNPVWPHRLQWRHNALIACLHVFRNSFQWILYKHLAPLSMAIVLMKVFNVDGVAQMELTHRAYIYKILFVSKLGHHWFRYSLVACSVPRHYLNQW